ncbi:flavin-containing monooxygenase [Massilia rubra]|nr:NAD(P)-binding domain-containing protein [Massilia rubra]
MKKAMHHIDTVVIGAGQAGLCMSYVLQRAGREHVVLEQAQALEQWRSARWDSFKINSPLAFSRLMGQRDGLPDRQRGLALRTILGLWDDCIAQRAFPIHEKSKVVAVEQAPDGGFRVHVEREAGSHVYLARNVIAAPGTYQLPRIPACAARIGPQIEQYRVGTYTNPSTVRAGSVLVVGGGQTGVQLSEELAQAGRRVYLATSMVKGTPRSHRGEDIMFWLERTGLLATPKEELTDPGERLERLPIVGSDHAISHHCLARMGVTLLGTLRGMSADGELALFDNNLDEHILFAQQGYDELIGHIEDWIARQDDVVRLGFAAPVAEPEWRPHQPLSALPPPTELNLRQAGIHTVIWATGWRADLSWLLIDDVVRALDTHGLPQACDTPVDGFFWLGFHWLRTRASGSGAGFHLDAPYIASRLR